MKTLKLLVNVSVNLLIGSSQVYIPCAKIGQVVGCGSQAVLESIQKVYTKAGIDTCIE